MICRLVEQYLYSYVQTVFHLSMDRGIPMLLYAGKQCRSGQDEYFQFRFQFRADDEVVFLIGVADVFCTDESSQADAPVNGFQVAGQGSVITAVHKKSPYPCHVSFRESFLPGSR